MTYLEATVYGALQGVTEFLPISSSAHLVLLPWLLGWKDPGLTFDVALHLGTLAAVAGYFWREWRDLLMGATRQLSGRQAKTLAWIALASVPAAAAGVCLDEWAETILRGPGRVAVSLIVFGLLLDAADRYGRRDERAPAPRHILGVGLAQALALFPGVSRSGVTMTAGLALGLEREAAARLSFLLALPITAGAVAFKLKDLAAAQITGPFLWAIAVSAATGLAAMHQLLWRLRTRDFKPYVVYRVTLGLFVLAVAAARG